MSNHQRYVTIGMGNKEWNSGISYYLKQKIKNKVDILTKKWPGMTNDDSSG